MESTTGDPGKLAMMDRVRSSRSTSGGVEVARRGVAGRLQPTLGAGPDVRGRVLEPISALSYLRRPTAVETNKGNASNSNWTLKWGVEANLRGASPVGRGEGDRT